MLRTSVLVYVQPHWMKKTQEREKNVAVYTNHLVYMLGGWWSDEFARDTCHSHMWMEQWAGENWQYSIGPAISSYTVLGLQSVRFLIFRSQCFFNHLVIQASLSGPGAGQALRVIAGDVAEGAGASTSGDVSTSQISLLCVFYQRDLTSFENLPCSIFSYQVARLLVHSDNQQKSISNFCFSPHIRRETVFLISSNVTGIPKENGSLS